MERKGSALVTGGSAGIAPAIAQSLAADGWRVAVNYRADEEAAAAVVEGIIAVGGDDRVREAHRERARPALQEVERYTQARIGNVHAPETTGKLIAATFEHDTARPVDGYAAAQLHTHAVIFIMTES